MAGVPRLFDLVRVRDERLKPAFYFALGNTVVAQDMEQASRIAYGPDKQWSRVVTLQVHSCLLVTVHSCTVLRVLPARQAMARLPRAHWAAMT